MKKTGRGKQVPPEGMRQPRETHKLLQVAISAAMFLEI